MDKILFDTDVILDFFFDRKPFAEDIAKVLSLCETRTVIGYTTPVIISNVYYLLRKTAPHKAVVKRLETLLNLLDVLSIEKDVILQALSSQFSDFEDALQNYSAEKDTSINFILTRNKKDYKHSKLPIFTAKEYLLSLS
ncbi:MAG: PIN domain-containing protein [Bacteroidales bacterium]|jgi:predicted nucleic acid-binding protein|nr:PIN domain-containing protein [Bacteroidales bacterium]